MKILSWNVNGIRAAYKKGLLDWFLKTSPDILCLQEIKANLKDFPPELKGDSLFSKNSHHLYVNSANRPGYSGTAVYTKKEPVNVKDKIGIKRFDEEGRYLELEYPDFILINLYTPNGSRDKSNMGYKLEAYDYLLKYFEKIKNKDVILIGDFNIAHEEIDLARPKQNTRNTMFTSEEREKISKMVGLGFVDIFRQFHKEGGNYTWWPYAFNARERNLGWRIDYAFVSKKMLPKVKNAFILPEVIGSDHCPVGIEIR